MAVGELTADEVRARLAFRALWPPSSPGAPVDPAEAFKVDVRIVVAEDFMSDSSGADAVQLKRGQTGTIKKVIDSGHVSIDFEEHTKLQWVSKKNLSKLHAVEAEKVSLKHALLQELNEALDGGLARRMKRIEEAMLEGRRQGVAPQNGSAGGPDREASDGAGLPSASQTNGVTPGSVHTRPLAEAVARALRTKPRVKAFGPSYTQVSLADPPEKHEDAILETTTLKLTLESLDQNIHNRRRQISSLEQQLATVEDLRREVEVQTQAAAAGEQTLLQDPSALERIHNESVTRRRVRVEELLRNVRKVQDQAKRYQKLFHHQRRYLLQTERITMIGGQQALARHPAGDVVLVSLPMALGEEKPEAFDIGTAIANPYTVDSWPFEPNVLARRTFQKEAAMEPFEEETEEALEEERRRLPFIPSLHFSAMGRHAADDESDEDAGGPTATSRSL